MITELQNTNDVQFIRVAFGDFNTTNITNGPQFNEIVYVWGVETRNNLKELGYNTILVSKDKRSIYYQTDETIFFHKLLALEIACKSFNKVLMLDWDYELVKPLDSNFFNYLNTKQFLCPVYSYKNTDVFEYKKYPSDWKDWHSNNLQDYSWKKDDLYIIPNAAMIYTNDNTIGTTLLDIANKKQIRTLIEEYTIYINTNCGLVEYIEKYHPTFMYGRIGDSYTEINDYVNTKLSMDIYFQQK